MKIFDAHLHIIDPRYPLVANNGYMPDTFTCEQYLERMRNYNLCGGAIVSGSFQGFDQTYLLSALQSLGPSFVGVINLASTVKDEEVLRLNEAGVRAVRFNLRRGGSENIKQLEYMAQRVFDLCHWHVELYVASQELKELWATLIKLPQITIDHLGLTRLGFNTLQKLCENGARVKASGFGRIEFDVIKAMRQIYSINPASLMFATDLPSTRAPRAYKDYDHNLILDSFSDSEAENIFYNNAIGLYKPKVVQ